MSEKNKFIVIDEKPKRGQQSQKLKSKRPLWQKLFVALGAVFLLLSVGYVGLCVMITDCGSRYPTSLELTATEITIQNATVAANLTVTQRLPRVGDLLTLTASVGFDSATAISNQQTRLAATQNALLTAQARIIPTLTALATPVR